MTYVLPDSKFVVQTERRWNRVTALCKLKGAAPSPPRDDQYVMTAFQFQRDLDAAGTDEAAVTRVAHHYKNLYEAWTLRWQADPTTRSTVESLLLSGKTPAQVAEDYGARPDVIIWYQKLWFDLGTKPLSRLAISTVLIPEVHSEGFSYANTDGYFKLLASIDPVVLQDALEFYKLPPSERGRHDEAFRTIMQYQALRASLSVNPSRYNAVPVIQAYAELRRVEQEMELASGRQGGPINDIMSTVLRAAGVGWMQLTAGEQPPEMHDATVQVHLSHPTPLLAESKS